MQARGTELVATGTGSLDVSIDGKGPDIYLDEERHTIIVSDHTRQLATISFVPFEAKEEAGAMIVSDPPLHFTGRWERTGHNTGVQHYRTTIAGNELELVMHAEISISECH